MTLRMTDSPEPIVEAYLTFMSRRRGLSYEDHGSGSSALCFDARALCQPASARKLPTLSAVSFDSAREEREACFNRDDDLCTRIAASAGGARLRDIASRIATIRSERRRQELGS